MPPKTTRSATIPRAAAQALLDAFTAVERDWLGRNYRRNLVHVLDEAASEVPEQLGRIADAIDGLAAAVRSLKPEESPCPSN